MPVTGFHDGIIRSFGFVDHRCKHQRCVTGACNTRPVISVCVGNGLECCSEVRGLGESNRIIRICTHKHFVGVTATERHHSGLGLPNAAAKGPSRPSITRRKDPTRTPAANNHNPVAVGTACRVELLPSGNCACGLIVEVGLGRPIQPCVPEIAGDENVSSVRPKRNDGGAITASAG
jgi:hypothetical protein